MPGRISKATSRSPPVLPEPLHEAHGAWGTVPLPPHFSHVSTWEKLPKNVFFSSRTSPLPLQASHCFVPFLRSPPAPLQTEQATRVRILIRFETPLNASSRDISWVISRSDP